MRKICNNDKNTRIFIYIFTYKITIKKQQSEKLCEENKIETSAVVAQFETMRMRSFNLNPYQWPFDTALGKIFSLK